MSQAQPHVAASPAPAPSGGFRADVQGLRAVAVLLVILAHAGFTGFAGGFIGVDVFFVISGFVITGLLLRQPAGRVLHNLRHFYIRRVLRIVPAATAVLVATPLVAYALLGKYLDPALLEDVRWATLFSANFRLINTSADYFMQGVEPSLITHFWSLAVEEQFYFGYPLIVFVLAAVTSQRWRVPTLRVFLASAVVASALWGFTLTQTNRVEAYYSPLTRFWELALGGLVATLPTAWLALRPQLARAMGYAGVALIALSLVVISPQSNFPGVIAWLPCGASALLLYSGREQLTGSPSLLLARQPLRYVGDISYSLYLWHYVWLVLPLQFETPPTGLTPKLIGIAGAFACAVVSYHFYENPIRHNRRLQRDGLAVLMILLVCIVLSWDASLLVEQLLHSSS